MPLAVTKPVNLSQLQSEMQTANVDVGQGLGMTDAIFRYVGGTSGVGGTAAEPADFVDEPAAQAVLDQHTAMRDKTGAEYATEFQDEATTVARKQEIRDIQNGLMPPEQVPLTQEEWETMRGVTV